MNSRTAGLLLIIGPIVTVVFAMLGPLGPISYSGDWSDTPAVLAAIGGNAEWGKYSFFLTSVGLVATALGVSYIRQTISDSTWINLGVVIILLSIPGIIAESALLGGAGNAASQGQAGLGTAASLYGAGQAIGAASTAAFMFGMGIIGIGLYIKKSFNAVFTLLLTIVGIIGVILCLYDYGSILMIIPYLGGSILEIVLGVLIIRGAKT